MISIYRPPLKRLFLKDDIGNPVARIFAFFRANFVLVPSVSAFFHIQDHGARKGPSPVALGNVDIS